MTRHQPAAVTEAKQYLAAMSPASGYSAEYAVQCAERLLRAGPVTYAAVAGEITGIPPSPARNDGRTREGRGWRDGITAAGAALLGLRDTGQAVTVRMPPAGGGDLLWMTPAAAAELAGEIAAQLQATARPVPRTGARR